MFIAIKALELGTYVSIYFSSAGVDAYIMNKKLYPKCAF